MTVCGVCGATATESLCTATPLEAPEPTYAVVRCAVCGVARTEPQPPPAARHASYDADYGAGAFPKLVGPVERVRRVVARSRARTLARLLPARAHVLGIGCGDGELIAALRAEGVRAIGVEGSIGPGRRAALNTGGQVFVGDPGHLPFADATFDAIVIWHVLEHLAAPGRTLAELVRCVRPGGLLVVAVPDLAGFPARLGGGAWLGLDIERHLYHFTSGALLVLLRHQGLIVRRRRHFNLEMSVIDVLDTALRRVGLGRLALYRHLGTGSRRGVAGVASAAVAIAGLPFAFLAALVASAASHGTDVQIWAERPADAHLRSDAPV